MRMWILFTFLFSLSVSLAFGSGLKAPPSAESVTGLETWIQTNISATDVGAETAGAVAAHNASTGASVHGLGTMSTATATDYVAVNGVNTMTADLKFAVNRGICSAVTTGFAALFGGTSTFNVNTGAGLVAYGNTAGGGNAGALKFYMGATDTAFIDFIIPAGTSALKIASDASCIFAGAVNFTATPTIAGVDVFGDISTALDEIIGAP